MPQSRSTKGKDALDGIVSGLGNLVEKLQELARTGESQKGAGSFAAGPEGRELRGIYGFTLKVGLGGPEKFRLEPFGNLKVNSSEPGPVVREVREPALDVFEEPGEIVVVAEMPGVSAQDVDVEVEGDVLTLAARSGSKRYRKEVLLPRAVSSEAMRVSCVNGVVEIRFEG